jgi:hypothetical protein
MYKPYFGLIYPKNTLLKSQEDIEKMKTQKVLKKEKK